MDSWRELIANMMTYYIMFLVRNAEQSLEVDKVQVVVDILVKHSLSIPLRLSTITYHAVFNSFIQFGQLDQALVKFQD